MRTINVSTDVFAGIWARRQPGEDSEDAILRRELGCKPAPQQPVNASTGTQVGGVADSRNGVHFSEGFKIFRNYKGHQYVAEAMSGSWVRLDNGAKYPTLNQLNSSIAAGAENVWNGNWKYRRADGNIGSIAELRR